MKFIIDRSPDYPDIHVHVSGNHVDVQYRGGATAIRATQRSTAHARLFAEKTRFWSGVHRDWEIKHLLEHVAWELEAAIFAARKRSRRSAFAS